MYIYVGKNVPLLGLTGILNVWHILSTAPVEHESQIRLAPQS